MGTGALSEAAIVVLLGGSPSAVVEIPTYTGCGSAFATVVSAHATQLLVWGGRTSANVSGELFPSTDAHDTMCTVLASRFLLGK
jgi:hypothetical protein